MREIKLIPNNAAEQTIRVLALSFLGLRHFFKCVTRQASHQSYWERMLQVTSETPI